MYRTTIVSLILLSFVIAACSSEDPPPVTADAGADAGPDASEPPTSPLKGEGVVTATAIYEAETFLDPRNSRVPREWVPVDVTVGPWGELWAIQRVTRRPGFDDVTECTERGFYSREYDDDDCTSLVGSTVSIADPGNAEPATGDNGRAIVVSDYNSVHFMRRPSGIAFGAPEATLAPGPGSTTMDGEQLLTETISYIFPFANCSDHLTGNPTDGSPFNGPSLWTADPSIYTGDNGTESWSNGSHLDMVHGTSYCTGIAWERDNVFWAINGAADSFDRYDFAEPHLAGHWYHDDATIKRYQWDGNGPVRVADVPSNVIVEAGVLYVADSGNGRVISMALDAEGTPAGTFFSYEGLESDRIANAPLETVIDQAALAAEWGGSAVPSGLAVLDPETLVVANNASGHVSLVGLDGTIIRTIDTGVGAGIGGLTVFNGVIYFTHMTDRRIYRLDVAAS